MARSVVMPDGQIINGVPDEIDDQQVRAEYLKQRTEQAGAKAGYPVKEAREIGIPEENISEYVQEHPKYAEEQAAQKRTEAMPWWQRQLEGAWAGLKETGIGLQQIVPEHMARSGLETNLPGQQPESQRLRDVAASAVAEGRGVRAGGGGPGYTVEKIAEAFGPGVLTRLGGMTKLSSFVAGSGSKLPLERYGGAATQGALAGETEPVTGDEQKLDKVLQAAAFAVGGQGLADAVRGLPFAMKRRALTGLNSLLPNAPQVGATAEREELGKIAKDWKMEIPAAGATGYTWLDRMQAAFESLPGGGWNVSRMMRKNMDIYNQKALASIGRGGNEINPRVLDQAGDDIGAKLDIVQNRKVRLDQKQFAADLDQALQKFEQLEFPDEKTVELLNHWKDVANLKGVKQAYKGTQPQAGIYSIDGERLLTNRSALAKDITTEAKKDQPNWQMVEAKSALLETIDNAIERSLPANQKGLYQEARQQYRNLKAIEMAYDRDRTPGYINPDRLASALEHQRGKTSVARTPTGTDDLIDMTRIHSAFKLKTPDSGTAGRLERAGLIKSVGQITGPGAAGGAAGFAMGGLAGVPPGAALGYAATPVLGALGTSSTLGRYLSTPMSEEAARNLATTIRASILSGQRMSPLGEDRLQ